MPSSFEKVCRMTPGYRLLAERQLHKKHFPGTEADDFRVLLLAPTPKRRDTVRRAFRESGADEQGIDLWRFASLTEVSPETFLGGDIFYACGTQPPRSIVRL